MAQVSFLDTPTSPPSTSAEGQRVTVLGLESIVPTPLEPISKGKWQVAILLQSSDLNLLLQPSGRAEFNEHQSGCSAESCGLRGTNLLLLLGLLPAERFLVGFIVQLYRSDASTNKG